MTPLEITLLILVLTIVAFITGKIPFSVISAGIMLSLIMTGVMEPAEAFSGFINTNVVMFVAMFVIGAGLTKTSLIDKAEQLVVRYKDNPKMLIFLACIASSLLASITSATATAAIMISLLVGIANEIGTSRSKLLYPAMACANIATSMTFLGQGASNITWIDIMAKAGAPNELYIWDFTIARIPLLVVSILYMTFVGYKLMPDIDNNTFVDGGHTGRKSAKLSPIKEKIAIIIIVVTILAMLFESVIGIPMYIPGLPPQLKRRLPARRSRFLRRCRPTAATRSSMAAFSQFRETPLRRRLASRIHRSFSRKTSSVKVRVSITPKK